MKITCCENCNDRKLGCHSICEKYITQKNLLDISNKHKADIVDKRANIDNFIIHNRKRVSHK
jgi:hypothetical protein